MSKLILFVLALITLMAGSVSYAHDPLPGLEIVLSISHSVHPRVSKVTVRGWDPVKKEEIIGLAETVSVFVHQHNETDLVFLSRLGLFPERTDASKLKSRDIVAAFESVIATCPKTSSPDQTVECTVMSATAAKSRHDIAKSIIQNIRA